MDKNEGKMEGNKSKMDENKSKMDENMGKMDQNHQDQDKMPKILRLNFRAKNHNCIVYNNLNFHSKNIFFHPVNLKLLKGTRSC